MPVALHVIIERKQVTANDNPDDKVDMVRVYGKHWDGEKIIRKNAQWIVDN
jgi:hypothetical protein